MWLKSWPWNLKTNKVIDKKPNFHYVKMLLSASDWNGINQNKSMSLHTVARSTNESYVNLLLLVYSVVSSLFLSISSGEDEFSRSLADWKQQRYHYKH